MARRRLIVALAAVAALAGGLAVAVPLALLETFGTAGWTRMPLALVDPPAALPLDAGGRTNVLLLGIGRDVDPALTDTILLLSMDVAGGDMAMVSVPRDLAYPFPDGVRRINEAYHLGAVAGDRGAYARGVVGDVLGVDIQRVAVVGIEGLRSIVDDLGGVPLAVDRAFTDEILENSSFDAGWQWLSGERALAFARARHAGPFEGTDFARIRRQQKLLVAIEKRLLSPTTLLDPPRLRRLFADVVASVHTDLLAEELIALGRFASGVRASEIRHVSLAEEGLVVEMRGAEGAYLLEPAGGDFAAIRRRVRVLLGGSAVSADEAGLEIVARADWDPNPPRYDGPRQKIRRIVIHHDGVDFPPGTAGVFKLRALRASVLRLHGWQDLPYHYAVDVDGRIFEGRTESWSGDTTTEYDTSDTLAIALLGNHQTEPPTAAQRRALIALVRRAIGEHALSDGDVYLHGDLALTDCPGAATRAALAGLWMHSGPASAAPTQPPFATE